MAPPGKSTPLKKVKAQQRLQRTLAMRVPLWDELQEREEADGDGESSVPQQSALGAGAAADPDTRRSGGDEEQPPAGPQPPARSHQHHQLHLLQEALCPLTHSRNDLQPHAAPKAAELYNELVRGAPRPPWYMISPDGTFRLLWDLVLFVLTAGLLVYIPVLIAFYSAAVECVYVGVSSPLSARSPYAPTQPASSVRFMTVTNLMFLLDIPLNFLTGVRSFNRDTGLVEYSYDLRRVAASYCKTWLVLDVVSCLPLECIVSAGPAVVHTYNTAHVNRLLKVFGLRRRAHGDPFRAINLLPWVARNFNYSMRLVVLSGCLLLLGLHYFACGLWLVLRAQGFPPRTWPVELGLLDDVNVFECWIWSVFAVTSAMIGLGYGSFPPMTFAEAVLWIVEMVCMAGGFAAVNGFIFSAILEMLASTSRYKSKLLQARREVERRRLPPPLSRAVISYFKMKHNDHNVQDGQGFMDELAPGLRLQVALASVGQSLSRFPLLRDSRQLLQQVALLVEPQVAPEGQLITIAGAPHRRLYILTRGYADVYMMDTLIDTLVAGDSFGESAILPVPPADELPPRLSLLWGSSTGFASSSWPNLFTVRALSACHLMVLEAGAFEQLLDDYPWVREQLEQMGRHHAAVLDALPMLEDVWEAAEKADPLRDPAAATAAALKAARDKDGGGADASEGALGRRDSARQVLSAISNALARPFGISGSSPKPRHGAL